MKYSEGRIGRVFVLKFGHGEDLLVELGRFAREKNVRSGFFHLIGALDSAEIVVGSERKTVPPKPVRRRFGDGREMVGTGTIFWNGRGPSIHLHSAIGREDKVNVGCLRKMAKVYLVIEAVVVEIMGTGARREMDAKTGLEMLEVGAGQGKKIRKDGKD